MIRGDLECEKEAEQEGEGGAFDIIQGEVVTYDIDCFVNLPGFDEGDPILIGDISINDQLPDNFEIEFATCAIHDAIGIDPF